MSEGGLNERISDCCGLVLCTFEWACDNLNHRASEGQLVCTGCGKGLTVTPEEYAAVLAVDKQWDAWSCDEGNQP